MSGGKWGNPKFDAGAVSEDQLDKMIQFWNDCSELPDWSVTQLKNVKW